MSEPLQSSMRDHAVALAKLGFRVFKLQVNGKLPAYPVYYDVASSDPAKVAEMWTEPFSTDSSPNNIAILTGDGLLVIDVDNKKGKRGDDSLNLLELLYLNCDTLTARTPSGGRHLFYRVPAGRETRNTASKLGDGLDTRGYHGYVVGAGSTIGDRAYEWVDADKPIQDAPEELLIELQPKLKPASRPKGATPLVPYAKSNQVVAKDGPPLVKVDHEDAIVQGVDYLRNNAPEAIENAGGDHTTYVVAARLGDFGLSRDTACELMLLHWNDEKACPPWTPKELYEKVTNAYRYRTSPIGSASAHADFQQVTLAPTAEKQSLQESDLTKRSDNISFLAGKSRYRSICNRSRLISSATTKS
jgi:hypothetical protein